MSKLISFCRKVDRLYLYGAGKFGKIIKKYLDENGISVMAFLVTHKTFEFYCGLPVLKAEEIMSSLDSKCGIVLSLSSEFYAEILERYSFPCPVFYGDIEQMICMPMLIRLKKWQRLFAPATVGKIKDGQRILIIQIERTYGDIIWTTALLRELHHNLPYSEISMVINRNMIPLLEHCPYLTEIIPYDYTLFDDESDFDEIYNHLIDFCNNFIGEFDVAFLPRLLPMNPTDLWENLFICVASNAKIRVAHMLTHLPYLQKLAQYYAKSFSYLVRHSAGEHEVSRNLSLLSACGLNIKEYRMELWISAPDAFFAKSILAKRGLDTNKRLCIALGIVGTNPARSWSPQHYKRLIYIISQRYPFASFIICGGQDAIEPAKLISHEHTDCCIDMTGRTTLAQAAAIIKNCNLYIGSDTGLMHMAAAFGKPIIEISYSLPDAPDTFGSHPVRTGPWCVPNVVLRPPYGLDDCKFICRKKYAHCINLISSNEVFLAFETLYRDKINGGVL